MGDPYGRVPDSVESGVLVPFPLRLLPAIEIVGLFHIVQSTNFAAALAYVASPHTCEIDWLPVPSSCHLPFLMYH